MGFLKRLFGGGGGATRGSTSEPYALYFYVRLKRSDEIMRVRIDLRNDLSQSDEGGYFVRKMVRAIRAPFPAELLVTFDDRRRMTGVSVENGESVDEAAYDEWVASQGENAR